MIPLTVLGYGENKTENNYLVLSNVKKSYTTFATQSPMASDLFPEDMSFEKKIKILYMIGIVDQHYLTWVPDQNKIVVTYGMFDESFSFDVVGENLLDLKRRADDRMLQIVLDPDLLTDNMRILVKKAISGDITKFRCRAVEFNVLKFRFAFSGAKFEFYATDCDCPKTLYGNLVDKVLKVIKYYEDFDLPRLIKLRGATKVWVEEHRDKEDHTVPLQSEVSFKHGEELYELTLIEQLDVGNGIRGMSLMLEALSGEELEICVK